MVASITPHLTSDQVQEKIYAVNAGMLTLCAEKEATFVDDMPSFRLGDGSLKDGYFTTHCIHLKRAGVNTLARNLKLPVKNNAEGVCLGKDPPRGRQRPGSQETPSTASKKASLSTEIHSVSRLSQRSSLNHRSQVRWFYFAETGHRKDNCKYGRKLKCFKCDRLGHKSKCCLAQWGNSRYWSWLIIMSSVNCQCIMIKAWETCLTRIFMPMTLICVYNFYCKQRDKIYTP